MYEQRRLRGRRATVVNMDVNTSVPPHANCACYLRALRDGRSRARAVRASVRPCAGGFMCGPQHHAASPSALCPTPAGVLASPSCNQHVVPHVPCAPCRSARWPSARPWCCSRCATSTWCGCWTPSSPRRGACTWWVVSSVPVRIHQYHPVRATRTLRVSASARQCHDGTVYTACTV